MVDLLKVSTNERSSTIPLPSRWIEMPPTFTFWELVNELVMSGVCASFVVFFMIWLAAGVISRNLWNCFVCSDVRMPSPLCNVAMPSSPFWMAASFNTEAIPPLAKPAFFSASRIFFASFEVGFFPETFMPSMFASSFISAHEV